MKHKSIYYLVCILLFLGSILHAQERRRIEIEYAPFMTFDESNPDATILTRNNSKQVHIKHEGIELWCDEAIYYGKARFYRSLRKSSCQARRYD